MLIHQNNYIYHDLHNGDALSITANVSRVCDLELCQQTINDDSKDKEIFRVLPYLAPKVLTGKLYTKESDIYSFGMITWRNIPPGENLFTIDRSHNVGLVMDVLEEERAKITKDTPEFYV